MQVGSYLAWSVALPDAALLTGTVLCCAVLCRSAPTWPGLCASSCSSPHPSPGQSVRLKAGQLSAGRGGVCSRRNGVAAGSKWGAAGRLAPCRQLSKLLGTCCCMVFAGKLLDWVLGGESALFQRGQLKALVSIHAEPEVRAHQLCPSCCIGSLWGWRVLFPTGGGMPSHCCGCSMDGAAHLHTRGCEAQPGRAPTLAPHARLSAHLALPCRRRGSSPRAFRKMLGSSRAHTQRPPICTPCSPLQEEGEQSTLTLDEVQVIQGALDMASKTAESAMTPIEKASRLGSTCCDAAFGSSEVPCLTAGQPDHRVGHETH